MVSWDITIRTKHGFTLTVWEIVHLSIQEGFTNIESIEYFMPDKDGNVEALLIVNNRCKVRR